jgi:hypothetical protein
MLYRLRIFCWPFVFFFPSIALFLAGALRLFVKLLAFLLLALKLIITMLSLYISQSQKRYR